MKSTTMAIAETVILELSKENRNRFRYSPMWHEMSEKDLWKELISCVLGSNVSREHANSALQQLNYRGFLEADDLIKEPLIMEEKIVAELSKPLYTPLRRDGSGSRFRFPRIRAKQICRSAMMIYFNESSLKNILRKSGKDSEARTTLVRLCPGIGPKQASLFLRNIGYSNKLAIIDSQVLKFMKKKGLITETTRPPGTFSDYDAIEARFAQYANEMGECPGDLDLAIWTVMRVAEVR